MKPAAPHMEGTSRSLVPEVIAATVFVLGLAAAIAVPNLIEPRKGGGNEGAAIGNLKTIGVAQSLFREADKEADGNLDYGSLSELGNAGVTGLIDAVLAGGTKRGYIFEASYGASTSEFIWIATARPTIPGVTGDRYFATNHEGVIFYSYDLPFDLDTVTCAIPGDAPLGH